MCIEAGPVSRILRDKRRHPISGRVQLLREKYRQVGLHHRAQTSGITRNKLRGVPLECRHNPLSPYLKSIRAMSLLLRLFAIVWFGLRRGSVNVLDTCSTPFRVWPNDLDVLMHMTNGRYFTVLDLGRVDLMVRCSLWPKMKANGWYPVVVLETMRFYRSLELWDRYQVRTRVIGWDDKHILLEQAFVRGEVEVAVGIIKARFLKRSGGTVSSAELLELAGINQASPQLPEWIAQWSAADGGRVKPEGTPARPS